MATIFYAYCWATGLIEFGSEIPEGAIAIASGEETPVRETIEVLARHGYKKGVLLVPGIPEAEDQEAAGDALEKFLEWASETKREGVTFAVANEGKWVGALGALCTVILGTVIIVPIGVRIMLFWPHVVIHLSEIDKPTKKLQYIGLFVFYLMKPERMQKSINLK